MFSAICAVSSAQNQVKVGAERLDAYMPVLVGQRVALVANQTSLVGETHLLDTLLSLGVEIKKVFTLEHGFRGSADAGERVESSFDAKTGVRMVSIYGKDKKPKAEELKDIDWIVYDVQDVGARFYTYISSLHYIMEAAAEQKKKILILDRPNPNGYYIDGPVLQLKYKSFVGMHPVPVVHGMTIGEYAKMINGEGWLLNGIKAELKVIPCAKYTHKTRYQLPIKPSPNLPNMQSVYLYPSLCLFEGTTVSVGRGTDAPFQVFGSPDLEGYDYTFTPTSREGAKFPPHKDQVCYGVDLRKFDMRYLNQLNIDWLINAYESSVNKGAFFTDFFIRLAGNDQLKNQIISGISEDVIRASWRDEIASFKLMRKKYLLYSDFE
ncbi:MAG TPA: DUF1343 domain-containing protein [Luteibaculaceae bacterium]|nr:DUF1343 domain-containing protein [Luteibaculaceae bacterium]